MVLFKVLTLASAIPSGRTSFCRGKQVPFTEQCWIKLAITQTGASKLHSQGLPVVDEPAYHLGRIKILLVFDWQSYTKHTPQPCMVTSHHGSNMSFFGLSWVENKKGKSFVVNSYLNAFCKMSASSSVLDVHMCLLYSSPTIWGLP